MKRFHHGQLYWCRYRDWDGIALTVIAVSGVSNAVNILEARGRMGWRCGYGLSVSCLPVTSLVLDVDASRANRSARSKASAHVRHRGFVGYSFRDVGDCWNAEF